MGFSAGIFCLLIIGEAAMSNTMVCDWYKRYQDDEDNESSGHQPMIE